MNHLTGRRAARATDMTVAPLAPPARACPAPVERVFVMPRLGPATVERLGEAHQVDVGGDEGRDSEGTHQGGRRSRSETGFSRIRGFPRTFPMMGLSGGERD